MPATDRARILIVDDDESVRDVFREMVEDAGYDVEVVPTAVGALAAVRERRPDVILLDLYMPGAMTGDQAMKTLAAFAPVVIITASTDEELGQRLLGEGAFDYVTKPFKITRILELIAAAIAYEGRRDGGR